MSSTYTPGMRTEEAGSEAHSEATPEDEPEDAPEDEQSIDLADEEFADEIGLAGKSCGWHPAAPEGEKPPDPLAGIIRGSRREPAGEDVARVVVEVTGGDGPNRLVDTARDRVHVVGR